MNMKEGLKELWNNGIKTLNIYWLEDIKEGDDEWWIDVCEDNLDNMCEIRWAWDIISKAEIEREIDENLVDYNDDINDDVIVVDKKFSNEIIKNAIEEWLKKRDFKFNVKIIDSKGTIEETHLFGVLNQVKSCYILK